MRIIRANPDRDENAGPLASDCVAHRCQRHADLPPVDDSADDGAECSPCVGEKYIAAYEKAAEQDILKRLFYPMVQSARDRLNLLSPGTGDQFEEWARQHATDYTNAILEG